MFSQFLKKTVLSAIILTVCLHTEAVAVSVVEFESHDILLVLDVPSHSAEITDNGSVQVQKGWNMFYLNRTADIRSFTITGNPMEHIAVQSSDTLQLPKEVAGNLPEIETEGQPLLVFFNSSREGTTEFSIVYGAEFHADVANIRFSNERVGGEVTGTILDKGAYLSPAAFFYPMGDEGLLRFTLTADLPESWESVSDGNRLSSETQGGRKVQIWQNPFESDGCMFMAAPYAVKSIWVDSIEVSCYFFESDTGLFDDYLTATANYIRMYSELIGPYPFKRFTVAENFFPTGYGMPAWTLLGQKVLRLPFIIRTSLGHEVLHNWWGNSVYVDYDRGNWCEGSTVYGADYRYKLMKSPAEACAYRKNILKQYVSYVDEGNDFPIREFQSRTSPGTRVIGYNKAMMVFHMIEEEIGTDLFFDAWKLLYEKHRGHKISWEEWIDAFEKSGNTGMSHVIPQWIDRTGAPVLALDIIENDVDSNGENCSVKFKLMEKSGQEYRLRVPLRFSGANAVLDTSVILDSDMTIFTLSVPCGFTSLEVDPEYHLFRRLYPEEVEPIVSAVLGNPQKKFISIEIDENAKQYYATFGENIAGDSITVHSLKVFENDDREYAPIMLNPFELPEYVSRMIDIKSDSITINETTYFRDSHTFILTGEHWNGFEKYMVILTGDYESLPRIGQLIPHYGKYSFLVFKKSRNVGKGQWKVERSPLRKRLTS